MPSNKHNGLVQLLRKQPGLVVQLLERVLGVQLPHYPVVTLADTTLGELAPTEVRADLVVELGEPDAPPSLSIIVEVQLDTDKDKLCSWPEYLTSHRYRRRCPVCVLVVTLFEHVAEWASRPIDLGPGNENFRVLVSGPRQMPPFVSVAAVHANPGLAILTVLAHARAHGDPDIVFAVMKVIPQVDSDNTQVYLHLFDEVLSEALRQALKERIAKMQDPYADVPEIFRGMIDIWARDKALARSKTEGKAEGRAKSLLQVLEVRGVAVTAEQRERILRCEDEAVHEQWLTRAITARTADELFD